MPATAHDQATHLHPDAGALLAVAAPGGAQELLNNYSRHIWHVQDGLVDQVVQALAQTPDRYLWIGTTKGLLRFDGRSFVPCTGAGATALSHGVTALLVARDGTLYIGTEGGGLLHLHGTTLDISSRGSGWCAWQRLWARVLALCGCACTSAASV